MRSSVDPVAMAIDLPVEITYAKLLVLIERIALVYHSNFLTMLRVIRFNYPVISPFGNAAVAIE